MTAKKATKKDAKGKLALYWAASCGGCEIAVLGINEKILDVANAFDIVLWPCVIDAKVRSIELMEDKSIDLCFFNGAIRTSEQEYMARLMRQKSKALIAFGSCAHEGCIPGLANATRLGERYDEGSDLPDCVSRYPKHSESRRCPPADRNESGRGHALPAFLLRDRQDPWTDC